MTQKPHAALTGPDDTLTFGEVLMVLLALPPILKRHHILTDDGVIVTATPIEWLNVAAELEGELKRFLRIPANVDQIISALQLVLALAGAQVQ